MAGLQLFFLGAEYPERNFDREGGLLQVRVLGDC